MIAASASMTCFVSRTSSTACRRSSSNASERLSCRALDRSRPASIASSRFCASDSESDIIDRRTEEAAPVAVYDGLTAKGEELPEGLNPRLRD